MKKSLFVFLMFFFLFKAFSQTVEQYKDSKVLYIYFNHGKSQEMFLQKNIKGEIVGEMYYIFFNNNQYEYLIFSHVPSVEESQVKFEHKSFLKKNKSLILNAEIMTKKPLSEIIQLFTGKDVYVIDNNYFKNNRIKLEQVRVQSSIPFEM